MSVLALVLAITAVGAGGSPAGGSPPDTLRFVVLGHLRGDRGGGPNPRVAEAVVRARALRPAFAVLTGDLIWGDVEKPAADPAALEREWNELDSLVATLGVPNYRVPGNHDISDLPSRDVWIRRYGPLPSATRVGGVKLLFLSSAWIPQDGDTRHNAYIKGVDLDSSQVRWLARQLETDPTLPTFAFVHHLLWWQPDGGRWWKEVHPLLAAAKVAGVFSGDYGPLKFSTLERDGVRYFQSSIELPVALPLLQNRIASRVLSAQFDCFLEVAVAGGKAEVRVHPVAEVSSGEFTPQRYREINEPPAPPAEAVFGRVWRTIGSPMRLVALGGAVLVLFGAGYLVGRRRPA
jgi:hypothetical protein